MSWLKQSTAITVKLGPFVDETDGKTAETGLTIGQADVRLSKNGGDLAQKSSATACTHDEIGVYDCPLDTTDTGTLGRLDLFVHESGALPVFATFMVVPANVWDALFGADRLQVHADEITAGLITSASFAAGAITAAAVATGAIDADAIADGAIDAGAIATGALTAAKFAAGAIDAAALAADAGTEIGTAVWATATRTLTSSSDPSAATIADAVWDEARSGHTTAGTFGEGVVVNSIAAGAVTAAAIATGAIDADAVASDAVTEIQSGLATAAALQTVDDLVDDLETRLTATRAGYLDNLSAGAVATAAALATVAGYVDTEVAAIKAKTDNLPASPAATGDIPSAATIADAVWDEARSGHVGAGSFGEGVVVNNIAAGAITAAAVATGAIDADAIADGAIDAGAIATGAITAAKFAAGAIDAAAVATGAIDADALAADAGTEIGTAVWATAARTLTAATNVTSTGAAVPITAGGLVSADVTAISTDATAANNAESFFDGTGYAGTGNTIPAVTTVNGLAGGVITAAAIATGAITNAKFAAGAIDAAAIATGAIDADALAADAVAEVADGVWDEARSGHTTAGTFGQGMASVQGNVTGSVASVTGNVGGSVGSVTGNVGGNVAGSVASVTGNVSGSIGSLAAQAKTDVNAEVVDALATDTYAEPGSVPAATSSLKDKINWLFLLARNKRLTTATTDKVRNDADTADVATATLDDNGTTLTRGEYS